MLIASLARAARRSIGTQQFGQGVAALALCSLAACDSGSGAGAKVLVPRSRSATSIKFVQVAAADPQTSSSTVTVKYAAAQAAGDLNVIAVGWNDTTSTVTSVTDTSGNAYSVAVGPTTYPGLLTQTIYYARNIAAAAAGANSVTVKFGAAAAYVDVRALEYSGLDTVSPLDAATAATGTAATHDSGALTTTGPDELLFAANMTTGLTNAAGAGFTSRIITSPDSDIAEDTVVATAGISHGVATGAGQWVMQAVAFRSVPLVPPSAPANLTAASAGSTEIDLAWSASSAGTLAIAGYRVERCQGTGCMSFAQIAAPAATSYADTTCAPNTSYSYRVIAVDTGGNVSGWSNVASATTAADTQPPTVPASLAATAAGSSQINVSWAASSDDVGVTGYLLERCEGAGCTSFAQIAAPTAASYADAGLLASTSYSYRVRATDAAGNLSGYSTTASATTLAISQPPSAPTNLVATAGSTSQIGLTWTASTGASAISSYLIERCQGAGCSSFAQIGTSAGTGYGDTGLLASTTYSYRVRAQDTAGNLSGYSNVASATTLAPPPSSGIKFVQVAAADPQAPSSTVTVKYATAQAAGDLNVIVVGWNDTTSTVTSVIDTAGNKYALAVGPTVYPGLLTQSIYYAPNIAAAAAGTNSVTVTFSAAAAYPDIRILEYSGVDTAALVDASAAAAGTAATHDSGALTTTGANELLFAANMTTGLTKAAGTGFTSRVITIPDSDIAEDCVVATAGSYHGVATGSGQWVMQAVAFRGGLVVSPRVATFTTTRTQQFTATAAPVTWSVNGIVGGSSAVGTITSAGLYTPPTAVGSYTITAATSSTSASATAYVTNFPGLFTYHNDNLRTGVNPNETVLSPSNVSTRFGPLFNFPLDGVPQASPLYVANVDIPGSGLHNVVYVATEHDTVYAIDADVASTTPLWRVSFINPAAGITSVPACDTGECGDISPEIGITGTPVIDPATSTLYVVAKTKEVSGGTTSYPHRLHALDLATGAEKLGGPVLLEAQVDGTGDGTDGQGHVPFISLRENQRMALALGNGTVYVAFASHGDVQPYHGWVLGYDASTLAQVAVYNDTPDACCAGIWQSGWGPGIDANGNVYVVTGNGPFDGDTGGRDLSDSFVKLSPRLSLLDWFTPHDQGSFGNVEPGSGGAVLLPDQPGAHPHLFVGAGKNGTIYVVDRDNFGHFHSGSDSQIVQSLVDVFPDGYPESNFVAPVVFGSMVYFGPHNDNVQAFALGNGLLSAAPVSRTSAVYDFPGGTLAVSANGTANAILWVGERSASGPGFLHAYDATNLTLELYRGTLPDVLTKYTVPTVANGKVYVGTLGQLAVFGLQP